jgi:uncharacterized membrane protein
MPAIPAPPVPLSQVGRAAHDIGLAGLLGGTLYGRLALHPSVTEISNEAERGKVVNAAWRRYGIVNSLSLVAVVGGWIGARVKEAAPGQLSKPERRLAVAKDALVGIVAVTGSATAAQGVRFSHQAPGGAVPLEDGDHVAAAASEEQRRAKRRVNVLGIASLVAELGLVGVNAALAQEGFRRPPRRRMLPGRR